MYEEMFSKQDMKRWAHMQNHMHKARKRREGWEGWQGCGQAKRGDIEPMVLQALSTKPMHGYEVIRYFEEQSNGMWKPSPGSVYPTLQMLEEQDLLTSEEKNSKKIYTITKAGRIKAKDCHTEMPWNNKDYNYAQLIEFRELFGQLKDIFKAIIKSGSEKKIQKTKKVLEKTRVDLQKILDEQ